MSNYLQFSKFTQVPRLEPRYQSKHQTSMCFYGVQLLVFIADLDPGWKQNKSQLTV